ncbi:MAG: dephospho-CoA kinase [Bacteroides sp.]
MKPIRIGITGGIGSGKSMVCRLLEVMGVPVYVADTETKRLMLADASIRTGLTELLGPEVYADGVLNKSLLASYLFSGPEQTRRVNGIVHPAVRADLHRWVESAHAPFVAFESAILVEAGFLNEVDVVVMVDAPLELRIARAMLRDNAPREAVESRVRSQLADEDKRKYARFTVINDDKTPLIPQVFGLISSLSENIDYLCPAFL